MNIVTKESGTLATDFNEDTQAAMIDGDWKILTGRQHSNYVYPNPSDSYSTCMYLFISNHYIRLDQYLVKEL